MRRERLAHQMTLQSRTTEADDFAGTAEAWSDELVVLAAVEPTAGKEDRVAEGLRDLVTHRITFAATPDSILARSGWRGVWGDRVFHFEQVYNEGERNRFMVAMAREER